MENGRHPEISDLKRIRSLSEFSDGQLASLADKPDLCDLVLIAQYHALIGNPEMKDLPPVASLPAFAKLGMGDLGVEQIVEFLKRSRAEIEAIETHLAAA